MRWASPVIWMRRTVAEDTVLSGEELHPGDKVLLFYNSANRDEDVFETPTVFDVRRDPNPHLGFGAAGPHFCLGAHLARREIEVMFRQLFERLPDIESRRGARPAALELHQRDQAPRLRVHPGRRELSRRGSDADPATCSWPWAGAGSNPYPVTIRNWGWYEWISSMSSGNPSVVSML